jgi:HD-like signal output (HDOD) protein
MRDPALTARIVRVANSPVFLRQREITTLPQAFMMIGLQGLHGIIAASMLHKMTATKSAIRTTMYNRSLFTALCAHRISTTLKLGCPGELFVRGLLHNLGQYVFLSRPSAVALYERALELIAETGIELSEAEKRTLGVTHSHIGALVAKKWGLPATVVRTILHYREEVDFPLDNPFDASLAIVRLSELLCHLAGIGSPEGHPCDVDEIARLSSGLGLSMSPDESGTPGFLQATIEQFKATHDCFD